MRCANTRASTSFGPPAANGLIMVRGRVGHSPALTSPVARANEATATSALTTFRIVPPNVFVFASDERDCFGHFQDSPDFNQSALEVGFGGGCTQAKPDAEAFALH